MLKGGNILFYVVLVRSAYLFIHPSICPSVRLSVHPSILDIE